MATSNAIVGALSVIIGGDSSALDKMLKGAESSITGFAKRVTSIAGGVGLANAVQSAASSMLDTIKSGLAEVAELAKMSYSTGVSIEQLSKLKYATDLVGVSTDGLKSGLQALSHGIADLATGEVTPATRALDALGVTAKNGDGTMKNSVQVLNEVADKFATYKDGVNKAKLAQDLFGQGGEALIPLLNRGSQGIGQLTDEADRFGLKLDGETKAQVLSFNTSLTKMDEIKKGLVTTIISKLAPSLATISGAMLDVREKSELVGRVSEWLGDRLKYVSAAGLTVVTVFDRLTASWGDLFKAASLLSKGDFNAAWNVITSSAGKTVDSVHTLKGAIDDIFSGVKKAAPEAGKAITDGVDAPATKAINRVKNALELYLDSSAKRTAAMNAEAATVGKSADQQAALRVQYEAEAIAKAKSIDLTDAYTKKIAEAAEASANAARQMAGANLTQQTLTPLQQRNQLLQQYVDLLNRGMISMQTFSLASMKVQFPSFTSAAQAAQDLQMQFDQLATSAVRGLGSAFAQVITGSKSAADAFGQFALQFVTQMIEMIAQALIFKAIMAVLGFAGGGSVDTMQVGSQLFPMFKAGGPISGPGTGTSDSIPAMLSNGEFVVKESAARRYGPLLDAINQDRLPHFAGGGAVGSGSGSAVGGSQMRTAPAIVNLTMGPVTTRDAFRQIIAGLNDMIADGYKLNVMAA